MASIPRATARRPWDVADRSRGRAPQIQAFLLECTLVSAGDRVQSDVLYASYKAWAKSKVQRPLSTSCFARALVWLGHKKIKSSAFWWRDLKLRDLRGDVELRSGDALEAAWLSVSTRERLAFLTCKLNLLDGVR